ncbi:MAG: hypothetical protein PHH06_03010 [Candidatus Gracilibacteria bacterium]|nr:hypothetical protein [Candidatus Gracilibacteria bacterium]
MKKSLVKQLYEQTNLKILPKEIRKEVFGSLGLGSFDEISQETINDIIKRVGYILNTKEIDNSEIFKLIGASNINDVEKICKGFGRGFTLIEAYDGTLENVSKIYFSYKISIESAKLIFGYLDKENVGIGVLNEKTFINFITYCRLFRTTELKSENIEEKADILKPICGINLDLEWFSDSHLFNTLQTITGKRSAIEYSNVDTKAIYKQFFQNFPQYTWIDENGEKYTEAWDKKHFKEENSELGYILIQNLSVDFINLFSDEFEDWSDAEENDNFMLFYNLADPVKYNILNFIKFIKQNNLFKINLKDVDKTFVHFIASEFKRHKIDNSIELVDGFFDEQISGYQDFSDPLLKSLILKGNELYTNLAYICELYKLPVKLSSFRQIEKSYKEKYKESICEIFVLQSEKIQEIIFIVQNYKKGFGKDLEIEDLLYIFQNSVLEIVEINYIYNFKKLTHIKLDGHINKEDKIIQLLQETFFPDNEQKFYREFFRQKDGNIVLNPDKRTLLKMIFDSKVEGESLRVFINNFSGLTLGKLVKFYRDSGISLNFTQWMEEERFLIQYSLNNNNYYYLKHNFEIANNIYSQEGGFYDTIKLKTILDKTGGFLTKTFVNKFIVEGCSEEELDQLISSYKETTEKILSSESIDLGEINDNMAEAIFMAYRPTSFTIEQIKEKLRGELQDNTEHLKKVSFTPEGYEKEFSKSEKRLKQGEQVNTEVIGKIENEILQVPQNSEEQDFGKIDFKKFFTSSTNLEELRPILQQIYSLNNDYRIAEYRTKIGTSKEYDYTRLQSLSGIFGVVTKDSFFSDNTPIIPYIVSTIPFNQLKTIFGNLQNIKDTKFKKLFEEYFKEEYLQDEDKLQECFSKLLFEQLKFIASRVKKEIDKELKKFGDLPGEGDKVRFNVCKNIASFFAMAGSELCTANDVNRHNEERYVPVNIIDENSKQIIGMLMMYVEQERDYLVVRGFNLRKEMYYKYDIDSIAETMVNFVREFALENGYKKVYIPMHGDQHLVSNFDGLRKSIDKISSGNKGRADYEKKEKFEGGQIGQEGGFTVNTLYLLLDL